MPFAFIYHLKLGLETTPNQIKRPWKKIRNTPDFIKLAENRKNIK